MKNKLFRAAASALLTLLLFHLCRRRPKQRKTP